MTCGSHRARRPVPCAKSTVVTTLFMSAGDHEYRRSSPTPRCDPLQDDHRSAHSFATPVHVPPVADGTTLRAAGSVHQAAVDRARRRANAAAWLSRCLVLNGFSPISFRTALHDVSAVLRLANSSSNLCRAMLRGVA